MEFMQKEKAERALEREQDKREIKEMISDGVKKEVEASVQPLKEKQAVLESDQEDMKNQFSDILKEVKEIKNKLESRSPASSSSSQQSWHGQGQHEVQVVGGDDHDQGLDQVVGEARRTIGLYRIDHEDLERMKQDQFGGAKSLEEQKSLAVKEYLQCELKIDTMSLERMKIEKTFFLNVDKPECLFVTFQNRSSVTKILDKTYLMRKESRIQTYIPRQFRDRARAINEIEYNLRQEEKCKTRIRMGLRDLQLYKKERGGRWEHVVLPEGELPPVDLGPRDQGTTSPPPGRPSQARGDKRSRESSGSPTGVIQKAARKGNYVETEKGTDWDKTVEEADLVTNSPSISPVQKGKGLTKQPDVGLVMSITGTPNKAIQPTLSDISSPVFTKQFRK